MKRIAKRSVILVTDGDRCALKAVQTAARNIGARCISSSAGNPTRLTGSEILRLIMEAPRDPVVVMLDDRGHLGRGKGERALEYLVNHPEIEVLGILAVASSTACAGGVNVSCSVTEKGEIIPAAVNKHGHAVTGSNFLTGDTVEGLSRFNVPVVIGIGDIGKMDGADDPALGAPITTKAFMEIINRSRGIISGKKADNTRWR